MSDSYTEAINLARLENGLQRCAEHGAAYPERFACAHDMVRDCVCPCVMAETSISNPLIRLVCEEVAGRH